MFISTKQLLVLSSASLVAASLLACSGSDGSAILGTGEAHLPPNAAASSSSSSGSGDVVTPPSSSSPSSSSSSSSSGSNVATDAGGPTKPAAIAKHCTANASGPMQMCLENVEGKPGDEIELDVYLLGNATCKEAQEMGGRLTAKPLYFDIQNVADVQGCRTRRYDVNPGGGDELVFGAFGANVVGGCSAYLPAGMKETIKIKILPNTPPGDYVFAWVDSGIATDDAACNMQGAAIGGTLRVLKD